MPPNVLKFLRHAAGNTTLLFALGSVPVLGAMGIAIDTFRAADAKSEISAALDAAVLAGASTDSDYEAEASKVFEASLRPGAYTITKATFKKTKNVIIDGTVTAHIETSFSKFLGFNSVDISLAAQAEAKPGSASPCIMALSTTASQAFLINSGAKLTGTACEIHVKSTANPAAIFNAGTNLDTKKICIAGGNIIDNGGVHPNLEKNCTTAANPYAGKIPVPDSTCGASVGPLSNDTTLNPGVYCYGLNFNGAIKLTLNPGLYVIKNGDWNVNGGQWTGNGVTFYFADTSKLQFNSGVKATLTAPTSGPYKDILMAEKEGLSGTQFIFDDNQGFDMTGALYLPSRELVFNSGSVARTRKMTAIANTVILNSVKWTIQPLDGSGSGDKVVTLTK